MQIPELLRNRIVKPVAVFGLVVTGHAVVRFLRKLGLAYRVYDCSGGEGTVCDFYEK